MMKFWSLSSHKGGDSWPTQYLTWNPNHLLNPNLIYIDFDVLRKTDSGLKNQLKGCQVS